jgi:hypothetical protein
LTTTSGSETKPRKTLVADQRVPGDKAEALAVLDDAMLFPRGGIDALQEK